MPMHVRGINALLCKRCSFEAKPPYGTQSIRHLNFCSLLARPLMLRAITVISSQRALPFAFFARRLIFFALVLALFAPPLCSSSFTALCAYSYAPSDAIITVSPFSSCPSHEENVASRSIPAGRAAFLFRAACRFDGESRTVPLLPYKRPPCRYTGLFYYIERCERLVARL